MDIAELIKNFIDSQPEQKRLDVETLHQHILEALPAAKLWFMDGKDDMGKVVANPQIGYGTQTMTYAEGKQKEFYQIGLSTNTTGISVYIMGLKDKNHLPSKYGKTLGKATVTGYCIKFKRLKDINTDELMRAISDGVEQTNRS